MFDLVCVCGISLQGNFDIMPKEQAAQHEALEAALQDDGHRGTTVPTILGR